MSSGSNTNGSSSASYYGAPKVKLMKRATDTDPMNDRMGMGAANSFTYGANTVIERATMLQMEMA
jgi:hypothetical protein